MITRKESRRTKRRQEQQTTMPTETAITPPRCQEFVWFYGNLNACVLQMHDIKQNHDHEQTQMSMHVLDVATHVGRGRMAHYRKCSRACLRIMSDDEAERTLTTNLMQLT